MKSTDRILAQRYARAFDRTSQTTDQAAAACEALGQTAEQLKQAAVYMQDPAVATAEKIKWVCELFAQNKKVTDFITVLLQAKRYYLLGECVEQVRRLLDIRRGIVRARVETAFALNAEQQAHISQKLSEFSGRTVWAQFAVEPQVLGGLRVHMDGLLIDGTLQNQLQKLQQELLK